VLRLKKGAEVSLFNDTGAEYEGKIVKADRDSTKIRIIRESFPDVEVKKKIAVGLSVIKGARMDATIEKSVELGAAVFIPFFSVRTVIKKETEKQMEGKIGRWNRIIRSATKQTGRVKLMQVESPAPLKEVLENSNSFDLKLVAVERKATDSLGALLKRKNPDDFSSVILLVGPEGGWEEKELASLKEYGFEIVSLGKRILRAETAVFASLSAVMSWLGEL